MEFEKCVKERRSVRKFSEKPVSQETIKELIDLCRYSPSWKNSQTAKYYAVFDENVKNKIADECVLDFAFNSKTIKRCPSLIVLTSIRKISGYELDGSFSTSKEDRWEVFDAGIAAQTFSLSAHNLGLGSVILGVFDEEKVANAINLPKNEKVAALIALGYPLEEGIKPAPKRKEIDELLTFI